MIPKLYYELGIESRFSIIGLVYMSVCSKPEDKVLT